MSPLVSIVIPTYNRVELLKQAIQSVLAQTFTDYEIIIINDGSDADIESMLREFDAPIRYVWQENAGPAAARNHGMEAAQGTFIAFLDDDDTWLPQKLTIQIDYMRSNPDVGLCYTSYARVDMDGNVNDTIHADLSGSVYHQFLSRSVMGLMATPTVMIRREVIHNIGGFDETMKFAEDTDFWCRVAQKYKVGAIDQTLSHVREHAARSIDQLNLDPLVHLEAQRHLLDKATANNPDVSPLSRRMLYANAYTCISCQVLLHHKDVVKAAQLLGRGLLYFPFPWQGIKMYLRHVGYFIRTRIARLKR